MTVASGRLPLRAPLAAPPRSAPPAGGRRTYAIVTLGCKLNQADSAAVAGRLRRIFDEAATPSEADLLLLNTCTVTHKADRDARKLVRALRRASPHALLAVMGCSTRRDEEGYLAMAEVDAVLTDARSVEEFLDTVAPLPEERAHACVPHFGDRTRAFLKIQEGCNFPCSYCIIPKVRGPSRSVPPGEVEEELRLLLGAGYREIVLTGVNTGEYGKDLGIRGGLPALVARLLKVEGGFRLRLNSVEPRAVTPELRALLRSEERLARHVQIPLQSGSDAVLAAMRRNYRAALYAETVLALAEEVPGVGIGADVLVGFPAETEADFEATFGLVERLPVAYLHVFTYSPREGTPAAALPPLPQGTADRRSAALRELAARKRAAFTRSFLGRHLPALTLAPEAEGGRALTDNFLTVRLEGPEPPNRFVRVRVTGADAREVRAVAVPSEHPHSRI